jgi:hypothetical protein
MYLGNQSTGYGKYTMTDGELKEGAGGGGIILGEWGGFGWFDHQGGTVTVNDLTLARQIDSTGYYTLSGAGELTTNTTLVGNDGYATFDQDGGPHTTNDLTLGGGASGTGIYNLFYSGDLNVTNTTAVGSVGTGVFNQYGSTHNVSSLWLGTASGGPQNSSGTYNLDGGMLNSGDATVGIFGFGEFNQNSGIHNVTSNLIIAAGPESLEGSPTRYGYYNLHNGSLDVGGNTVVGNGNNFFISEPGGKGEFHHDGGTHTTDSLILGGAGSEGNGTGFYYLSDQPSSGEEGGEGGGVVGGELYTTSTVVGEGGSGYFGHTGGTHTTTDLTIAQNPGSDGTYNMEGGVLNADTVVNYDFFNFQGGTANIAFDFENFGTFQGSSAGTFTGDVSNYGIMGPGSSPGVLAINGNYTQSYGTLDIELAGHLQGFEYDLLSITGTATLDGTLTVSLLDSFLPGFGNSFSILEAASGVSGTFGTLDLPSLGGGLGWEVAYNPTNVNLTVTPEPLAITLFLLGGAPIAVNIYRKHRRVKA